MRVLCVDDAEVIRSSLAHVLSSNGIESVQAESGSDALDFLKESEFDVIITDLNMPGMSGFQMVEEINAQGLAKGVPILMLTTEASVDMKKKGKTLGVKAWIVKPFNAEALVNAVNLLSGK